MLKILVVPIFVILLILVSYESAYGLKSTYDVLKPLKWGNPQVCILEPDYESGRDPKNIAVIPDFIRKATPEELAKYNFKKMPPIMGRGISDSILKETTSALDTWESLLKQQERSRDVQKNWDINYKIIKLEQQKTFDEKSCPVVIKFTATPSKDSEMYRTLGVTENQDTEFADHRLIYVYYQKVGSCESHRDERYIYYKPCYLDDFVLAVQIGNTVRHEFGHALGLGHYYFADDPDMYWKDASTPAPSIMTIFGPDLYDEQEITQMDIDKVREIYGKSGFLKQEKSPIKSKTNIESDTNNKMKTKKKSDTTQKSKEKKTSSPIANFVKEGDLVTLSSDTKTGDRINWKQISGPKVQLSSTTTAELSFVAPDVKKGQVETLTFRMIIKDKLGNTSTDTIRINILSRD